MTQLPPCRFRGAILDKNMVECSCESLIHREPGKAHADSCLHPCPYRDEAVTPIQKSPPLYVKAWNFFTALAMHARSGFAVVTAEQFKTRLKICMDCDKRVSMECTACGCPIEEKCSWATQGCPLKEPKWHRVMRLVEVVEPGK